MLPTEYAEQGLCIHPFYQSTAAMAAGEFAAENPACSCQRSSANVWQ